MTYGHQPTHGTEHCSLGPNDQHASSDAPTNSSLAPELYSSLFAAKLQKPPTHSATACSLVPAAF